MQFNNDSTFLFFFFFFFFLRDDIITLHVSWYYAPRCSTHADGNNPTTTTGAATTPPHATSTPVGIPIIHANVVAVQWKGSSADDDDCKPDWTEFNAESRCNGKASRNHQRWRWFLFLKMLLSSFCQSRSSMIV
jgi:hypothetical protein